MSQKLSTKEAAAEIGTDARTLRKFIRSESCEFDAVGQGKRYEFSKGEVNKLKKAFLAWSGGAAPKKTKRDAEPETGDIVDELTGDLLDMTQEELDALGDAIGDQDEVDRTTEEVDLDDDGEPVDLEDLDGPSDDDLIDIDDIEIEDIDLD
jgi:hypothetical protein